MESKNEKMAIELKWKMQRAENIAITSDSWTALTTESYLTITCYFVAEGKMVSAVLQTRAMEERHTAENLAEHLKAATQEWGLVGKVIACVHDNATNMVVANHRLLEWESVPCFAHTLQLAINDGFKATAISRLIAACARLGGHFHHSTVATVALRKKQEQQELPRHKLIQLCKTRWNSVNDMLERLHEQRWAVTAVLSERTVTKLGDAKTLELTDDNWQTIENILPVLNSLKTATTALCGEAYVPVSMVYPVTISLLNRHLKPGDDSNKVADFKKTVATSLRRRMAPADTEMAGKVAQLASALDPRHKSLSFLDFDVREAVRHNLAAKFHSLPETNEDQDGAETDSTGPSEDSVQQVKRKKKDVGLNSFFGEDYGESTTRDELEQYDMEPCIPINEDPLVWWEEKAKQYPKLTQLARRYLCVPTTSVPAERVRSCRPYSQQTQESAVTRAC
ncbi:hypothetical protein SKAU_G00061880 [Synaphobranchus kaupii]|uniref:HAT C-terminal dimerisation domain-containing protein n=1 Tax=Synaphobranchus kaupii TaxID=118154 RepID=A0A9Q1G4Z3_SYNKA|nr:hypothetical protein SKAU_G00061880 [Synaphobranchus kaupii]